MQMTRDQLASAIRGLEIGSPTYAEQCLEQMPRWKLAASQGLCVDGDMTEEELAEAERQIHEAKEARERKRRSFLGSSARGLW
jgi:sRNA-binding protein